MPCYPESFREEGAAVGSGSMESAAQLRRRAGHREKKVAGSGSTSSRQKERHNNTLAMTPIATYIELVRVEKANEPADLDQYSPTQYDLSAARRVRPRTGLPVVRI
jgi:hypothetical protein